MKINPAGPDQFSLSLIAIKVSGLTLPKPSDQRCDTDRLLRALFLRPWFRRAQATMRVDTHLFSDQRSAARKTKAKNRYADPL